MRRFPFRVVLAGALLTAACLPATAAAFDETPCGEHGLLCSHVAVPLDRSGVLPGTISLDVRRLPAAAAPTPTALLVLAGGPGQVSTSLAESLAPDLAKLAPGRDIVLFDERGVGGSDAITCPGLNSDASIARCATQLGPARGLYTSVADAEDIESVRQAGGYGQLALYGTSYGTKVALIYAAAHPGQAERLILDSVVTSEGPDPLQLSTFAAIPDALGALCADDGCHTPGLE